MRLGPHSATLVPWRATTSTLSATTPGHTTHHFVCRCLPAGLSAAYSSLVPSSLSLCRGSDLRLPFECPADYVFYTPLMDMQPGLNYRVPGFLEDPWVSCACWACCAACAAHARGACNGSIAPIGSCHMP